MCRIGHLGSRHGRAEKVLHLARDEYVVRVVRTLLDKKNKMKVVLTRSVLFNTDPKHIWVMDLPWVEVGGPIQFVGSVQGMKARRLMNPDKPIRSWGLSLRPSKVSWAYSTIYITESEDETIAALKSISCAWIVFDDRPYRAGADGCVWVNFRDIGERKAYGHDIIASRLKGFSGYLDVLPPDVDKAKFPSLCRFSIVMKRTDYRAVSLRMGIGWYGDWKKGLI